MNKPRCLLLLALAVLPACKRTEKQAPPPPPSTSQASVDAISSDVTIALVQLGRVRGLVAKRSLKTVVLPSDEYSRLYVKSVERSLFGEGRELSELWTALNFADSTASSVKVLSDIVDPAQNTAFYDASSETVYVRAPKSSNYQAADDTAVIMALARALQSQNFGPAPSIGVDVDRGSAVLALREGDAWASAIAYFAARSQTSVTAALDHVAKLTAALPPDALATAIGYTSALAHAPLLLRETVFRLRVSGLQLVADLVRTKGFALVDRALQSPPSSMLDVLDPTFYARGWKPAIFPPLEPPASFHEKFSATLGSVGVLSFVERCESTQFARMLTSQWRGDSATFLNSESANVIVWRTWWKDAVAAKRFADYASTKAQCSAPGTSSAAHFGVLQRGNSVALTNLRDDGIASTLLSGRIDKIALDGFGVSPIGTQTLAASPTGGLKFAGRDQVTVRGFGKLSGQKYLNSRLGIEAEIPPGFQIKVDEILAIDHAPPSLASGRVSFEQTAAPFEDPNDFFPAFSAKVAASIFRGAPLTEVETGQLQNAMGPSISRVYEMRSGVPARVRLIAMPLCDKHAALVVTEVFLDNTGEQLLNSWQQSFKPTQSAATVCSDLATGR